MWENVKWLGHAGIQISGSKTVYVDPYQIQVNDPADLILITHDHYDHLSPDDILKIRTPHTQIIIPEQYAAKFKENTIPVQAGDKITVQGIAVEVVPAYNPSKKYHPKSAQNVGYIITMDDTTYYHAGDTDLIPEMKSIKTDVAFLPVGGTFTMTSDEAAIAAEWIKPRMAIPIHYGSVVGSPQDAVRFRELCSCEVRILSDTNG